MNIQKLTTESNSTEEVWPLSSSLSSSLIPGALDLRDKTAVDAFVPLKSVFMLEDTTLLDSATMATINERGHSRIPVYHETRTNIVGVLIVKNIIAADPEDGEPITG